MVDFPPVKWDQLIDAARAARERAYAPYSRFRVGAAAQDAKGRIFAGCNVENHTFGATICAERVAVCSAIVQGAGKIEAIVVVTDTSPPSPPCGLCLETLTEFGSPQLPILLANLEGKYKEFTLQDFLPQPFEFAPQPE